MFPFPEVRGCEVALGTTLKISVNQAAILLGNVVSTRRRILQLIEGRAIKTIALIKDTHFVNFVKPVG